MENDHIENCKAVELPPIDPPQYTNAPIAFYPPVPFRQCSLFSAKMSEGIEEGLIFEYNR